MRARSLCTTGPPALAQEGEWTSEQKCYETLSAKRRAIVP